MSKKQLVFLRERLEALAAKRPAARALERKLLAIGGKAVVFSPTGPAPLEQLVSQGRLWRLRRVPILGKVSHCHANSAAEWWRSRGRSQLATGWALSSDGLWREHSWCMRDGRILETTPSYRRRYFGNVLDGVTAWLFAVSASLPAAEQLLAPAATFPRWLDKAISDSVRGV